MYINNYENDNSEKVKKNFLITDVNRGILVLNVILTLVYFYVITFAFSVGNKLLFSLLIAGEVFHVYQVLAYIYTIWQTNHPFFRDESYRPTVDVFITVAGEPADIVTETVKAAKEMDYPSFRVYILNDGYVAKKENWREIEVLAKHLDVLCITRKTPGGAKAGNINNAVKETTGEYVVIFDADHVPHRDFLKKTIPYMADPKVAFVQSPQFYKNYGLNYVTMCAWEQQELFFGPLCKGRNRMNSATMCGTNMVIRREALASVGGMDESITEDFTTSMFMHQKGWKSVYVPEVLAEGLAPEDFLSYFKQQLRWARGSLDVVFRHNLFSRRGLTWRQKLQYFSSVSFYFSGIVVIVDALIPLAFLFGGQVPIVTSTMMLAAIFLPYIFLTLYILQKSNNFSFTFRSLAFSMSGFTIHLKALLAVLTREKPEFAITPKKQQTGNFMNLVIPHITYVVAVLAGIIVAFIRDGLTASLITNSAWAILNVCIFLPFIYAAMPFSVKKEKTQKKLLSEYN